MENSSSCRTQCMCHQILNTWTRYHHQHYMFSLCRFSSCCLDLGIDGLGTFHNFQCLWRSHSLQYTCQCHKFYHQMRETHWLHSLYRYHLHLVFGRMYISYQHIYSPSLMDSGTFSSLCRTHLLLSTWTYYHRQHYTFSLYRFSCCCLDLGIDGLGTFRNFQCIWWSHSLQYICQFHKFYHQVRETRWLHSLDRYHHHLVFGRVYIPYQHRHSPILMESSTFNSICMTHLLLSTSICKKIRYYTFSLYRFSFCYLDLEIDRLGIFHILQCLWWFHSLQYTCQCHKFYHQVRETRWLHSLHTHLNY